MKSLSVCLVTLNKQQIKNREVEETSGKLGNGQLLSGYEFCKI